MCQSRQVSENTMAKPIHSMIRVIDKARSVTFYSDVFGRAVKDRFDWWLQRVDAAL